MFRLFGASSRAPVSFLCVRVNFKGARHISTGGGPEKGGVVATVFGATGFTGRYVVETLANAGLTVIVPFRGEEKSMRHLKVIGQLGQIVPVRIDVRDPATIERAVFHSNIVVNMISRFWETRNFTFDDVNVKAATLIAEISKNVDRYVHISAAGVSKDSESPWSRTKAEGEEAVKKILPWATVIKPTLIFGDEDRVLNRFGRLSLVAPVIPVVKEAEKKLVQPLSPIDFADAILASLTRQDAIGKTYVLGGPRVMSWEEIGTLSFDASRRPDTRYRVSEKILYAIAGVLEKGWLMGGEPIFTRAELQHYNRDVVVNPADKSFTDLGITRVSHIEQGIARVARVYRDPVHQSDLVDQSPHAYKD